MCDQSICYYLCCCGCCGLFCKKYVKKDNIKEKERTLRKLNELSLDAAKGLGSKPASMKTDEMTNFFEVPSDKFKTEDDVLASYGYILGQEFGSGAQGNVFKAKHKDSDFYIAIKVIQMPEVVDRVSRKRRKKALLAIKRELFVLQTIRHPHIIQLINHFVIAYSGVSKFYILLRYAEHGDMSNFLKRKGPFNEKTTKIWFAQLLSAMVYMHSKKLGHRDLKLSNILLDQSDDVLITDFGLAEMLVIKKDSKKSGLTTYCGTTPNMPPEVLEKKEYELWKKKYDPYKVDVWSLGIVLYNLLNGTYPFVFSDKNRVKGIKNMKKRKWEFSKHMLEDPSPQLREILKNMLEPKPEQRPTMSELTRYEWVADVYKSVKQKVKKYMDKSK